MAKRFLRPKKKLRSEVKFALNGQLISVSGEDVSAMLGDFLRKRRSLTGTKIVCAEGDCGACTVLKASPFETLKRASSGPRYLPVNSCIIPVATLDGASVVTVDGLASKGSHERPELHPAQEAMLRCHGSQCGFCTPGFVMALTGLVEKRLERKETDSPITEKEARNALTANLCRCTGYSPIIQAACSIPLSQCQSVRKRHENSAIRRELVKTTKTSLSLETEEFQIFAPTSLKEAGEFLRKNSKATLVSGATDLGVIHNKRKKRLGQLLSLHLIPELYRLQKKGKNRLLIGSRVTLSDLRDHLKEDLIPEFARFLDLFASPQIKNQATLAGNLANASPIGDTPPFLLVAGTIVHVFSPKAKPSKSIREIPIEKFFLGYRKTALKPGEFITAIEIEQPSKSETLVLKKVSQRKDLDISTVNAAFRLKFDSKRERILESRIAYGGVAATP
ncbi:MAG: FAD binding domain-containing protein, partial [Bdellovibrionales bacterium]|nr:FAD binding domain-containing protein [Bdellovibrionales bacterium]